MLAWVPDGPYARRAPSSGGGTLAQAWRSLPGLRAAAGGFVSRRLGSRPVALTQLSLSGLCCVLSPLCFALPTPAFLAFLLFWGIVVVGDSPQFAALVAQESPPAQVGSIVTLVNAIGFAITVVSIQLLDALAGALPAPYVMAVLAAGPIIGVAWAGAGGWRPAPR
ncbi:transporter [Bordetella pertussis]|nr:transporter [Bordetella pertussis]